jgi:hypothetical protein
MTILKVAGVVSLVWVTAWSLRGVWVGIRLLTLPAKRRCLKWSSADTRILVSLAIIAGVCFWGLYALVLGV